MCMKVTSPHAHLATSPLHVHEVTQRLAACICCHPCLPPRMGYCNEEFMVTVAEAWPPGGTPSNKYTGGDDPTELYWPRRGAHGAAHFGRYFNQTGNCLLGYRFSAAADKGVPWSEEPQFRGGMW
jgi:hypothetical protein